MKTAIQDAILYYPGFQIAVPQRLRSFLSFRLSRVLLVRRPGRHYQECQPSRASRLEVVAEITMTSRLSGVCGSKGWDPAVLVVEEAGAVLPQPSVEALNTRRGHFSACAESRLRWRRLYGEIWQLTGRSRVEGLGSRFRLSIFRFASP
jgi:hypothetical protein